MIHIYTGNGKGKTTAALGLCLRAAGAGKTVFFCQFLKGRGTGEAAFLRKTAGVCVEQFGRSRFITGKPSAGDIRSAERGLRRAEEAVLGGKFAMVILDEVHQALELGLLDVEELLSILRRAPEEVEIVLTGRNAPAALIKKADLVSEVREVKHYFRKGVKARKGIEY
jgi:cob(I)alamin adenosyltransferase